MPLRPTEQYADTLTCRNTKLSLKIFTQYSSSSTHSPKHLLFVDWTAVGDHTVS